MQSVRSTLRTHLTLLLATITALAVVAVPAAFASHVDPVERTGNPTCSEFGDWAEFKVEPVASGTYSDPDGPLEVTLTVEEPSDGEDARVFDWSSNLGVDAVFVKGGDTGNLYTYDPESKGDTGLHAPVNPANNEYYGLSHVSFCYDVTIDLVVDKVNDADNDGTFGDSEQAEAEGDAVEFRVTVTNPSGSEAAVDLSSATDTYPTTDGGTATVDLFEVCDTLSDDTVLAAGESVTCTFTLTDYAPAAGGSLTNTVTVAGHEQGDTGNTASDDDDSTVTTPLASGGPAAIDLVVDKVNDADDDGTFGDSEQAEAEGDAVEFRVTVTNPSGSEAAVDLSSATDTYPTTDGGTATVDLFEVCDTLSDDTVLAAGESVTCTFTLTDYAPAAGDSLTNTVTVDGHEQGDTGNTTSDNDESTVTTPVAGSGGPAAIDLVVDKVNDADDDDTFTDDEDAPAPGADVTFRVTVTNPSGSEAAVDLSSATDTYPTTDGGTATVDLFEVCDTLSDDTVLAAGESVTCTFTLTDYAPAAGDSLTNTVTVAGHEQGDTDNTTSDNDDSTVTTPPEEVLSGGEDRDDDDEVVVENPAIDVTKVALATLDGQGRHVVTYVADDGDEETIEYRYTVLNVGDVVLTDVTLTDDVLGTIELPTGMLAPGQAVTVNATHVVTGDDAAAGEVVNVAVARGTSPQGEEVQASAEERVLVTEVLGVSLDRGPAVDAAVDEVAAQDELPRTGSDPVGWASLAFAMLLAGGALLLGSRRRVTAR